MKRALISVSDKTGIVELAKGLASAGVQILSTGGTARVMREGGVTVVDVAEYTDSPEVMDGRVKTLHPRVHGGILMRDTPEDRAELETLGGAPIDLVVVNLYPFEATVARGAGHEETIENIDIGGPSMVRSAAKNHARVTVVTDPNDYSEVLEAIANGGTSPAMRARLAGKAFAQTAAYDGAIAGYLTGRDEEGETQTYPQSLSLSFEKAYDVRYGENPHQAGAFYVERDAAAGTLARAKSVGGGKKELSFNNLVDADATFDAVREFDEPAAVVVKHTNPCGVATSASLVDAFRTARAADSQSAFGGIVAFNRPVDLPTAEALAETFLECVIAPSFEADALKRLKKKGALRLLATGDVPPASETSLHYKRISGGLVVQMRDNTAAGEVAAAKVVTKRAPTAEELTALDLGWRVCKHVKSNAIVFSKPGRSVGIGAGQMSRVLAVEIAVKRAGEESKGAVMASDAFFPFADGVETAIAAGVTAVVQPGGSKRDDEVIAACDAAGIAMIMTGVRHFKH